jgi:UDP-4-amino-4,6-dideoxy-N-acetyl-beta-L-altrosamine N-acetyltransferase
MGGYKELMAIIGKKVTLSAVNKESIEQFRKWRNRPELRKYFREYKELSKEMQERWFESKVLGDTDQVNFEIRDKKTSKLIGHCGLYYISWVHRHAEFGIYIGDDSYRGGGYGSDALRVLIKYGFDDLNLNRIWCEVYDNNDALKMYEHIGFVREGVFRQSYYNEGRYWDAHILALLKEEFKT